MKMMNSYEHLAARIATHWYHNHTQQQEQRLEEHINSKYLSQCDTAVSKRILLMVGHQKALSLFLNDPESRNPARAAFERFERVTRKLSRSFY